jgi:hypothetical protein
LGAARVCSEAISFPDYRAKAAEILRRFFEDGDNSVQEAAVECFQALETIDVDDFSRLAETFVNSSAFATHHHRLIRHLERAKGLCLPEIVLTVCEKFLDCVGKSAADIGSKSGHDGYILQRLVFRIRDEISDPLVKVRCNQLIDRMGEIGVYGVETSLKNLENEGLDWQP